MTGKMFSVIGEVKLMQESLYFISCLLWQENFLQDSMGSNNTETHLRLLVAVKFRISFRMCIKSLINIYTCRPPILPLEIKPKEIIQRKKKVQVGNLHHSYVHHKIMMTRSNINVHQCGNGEASISVICCVVNTWVLLTCVYMTVYQQTCQRKTEYKIMRTQ